jgi:probable rRNA maturation factor
MAIKFFNADVNFTLRDKTEIRSWLLKVAAKEGYKINLLNIIFCSDEYLYKMNVEYLRHNTYTDIITFDQSEEDGNISGELYLSIDRIRENAKILEINLRDEVHRVIVHGLLHLCGYVDKTASKKAEMSEREDYSLSLRKFL